MRICVVIPCYKVKNKIISVLKSIGPEIDGIFLIDDHCPEHTGSFVKKNFNDKRLKIITHKKNKGVGGAVISGYLAALEDGYDILVKIDGDGQMDPSLLSLFTKPIINNLADYTKGNRFYSYEMIKDMPYVRLIGNAFLSLMNKLSSGYWNIFDPTNGFTAIHANIASQLPFTKISNRYFFESDILFRLGTIGAKVIDIPMYSKYEDEKSNLKIHKIFFDFLMKHLINTFKRIIYRYFLREFNFGTLCLPLGMILLFLGFIFGIGNWIHFGHVNEYAPTGTIVLPLLLIILGFQLFLLFIVIDINSTPKEPIHNLISSSKPQL